MKTVIAIDSFKGSLSSLEAGKAAAEGIKRVFPDADTKVFAMADGGEGTVDALSVLPGAQIVHIDVHGPLMNPVKAKYCILNSENLAVMEMAEAAGINLISRGQLNPMNATTFGVGEMIKDAMGRGCRKFIIGIGGSATNDGGIGMLQPPAPRWIPSETPPSRRG